jgi:tetratricopeptide (TPR) repeat protein
MQAKYDEAIQYLDTAIKLDPNNVLAWGNKGYALFSQQKL